MFAAVNWSEAPDDAADDAQDEAPEDAPEASMEHFEEQLAEALPALQASLADSEVESREGGEDAPGEQGISFISREESSVEIDFHEHDYLLMRSRKQSAAAGIWVFILWNACDP